MAVQRGFVVSLFFDRLTHQAKLFVGNQLERILSKKYRSGDGPASRLISVFSDQSKRIGVEQNILIAPTQLKKIAPIYFMDGSIEAEIESGSRMSSEWRVRTGDGHVTLRLPSNFSAELDVHTGDGHIDSDLPVTVSGLRRENELRGKLNAGGPPLVVRTNDGSIRLERL